MSTIDNYTFNTHLESSVPKSRYSADQLHLKLSNYLENDRQNVHSFSISSS